MTRQIHKKMEISSGAGITLLVSKEINAVATQIYIGSHGHFIIIKFLQATHCSPFENIHYFIQP